MIYAKMLMDGIILCVSSNDNYIMVVNHNKKDIQLFCFFYQCLISISILFYHHILKRDLHNHILIFFFYRNHILEVNIIIYMI